MLCGLGNMEKIHAMFIRCHTELLTGPPQIRESCVFLELKGNQPDPSNNGRGQLLDMKVRDISSSSLKSCGKEIPFDSKLVQQLLGLQDSDSQIQNGIDYIKLEGVAPFDNPAEVKLVDKTTEMLRASPAVGPSDIPAIVAADEALALRASKPGDKQLDNAVWYFPGSDAWHRVRCVKTVLDPNGLIFLGEKIEDIRAESSMLSYEFSGITAGCMMTCFDTIRPASFIS